MTMLTHSIAVTFFTRHEPGALPSPRREDAAEEGPPPPPRGGRPQRSFLLLFSESQFSRPEVSRRDRLARQCVGGTGERHATLLQAINGVCRPERSQEH